MDDGHIGCISSTADGSGAEAPAQRLRRIRLRRRRFRQNRYLSTRRKGNQMNRDIVGGKWQQVRGKVKEEWGKLTDDDLKVAEGKFDKLAGLIRERYGYTREKAEEELERFCKKHHVYVEEEIKR